MKNGLCVIGGELPADPKSSLLPADVHSGLGAPQCRPEEFALLLGSSVSGHVRLPESRQLGEQSWASICLEGKNAPFKKFLTLAKNPRGGTKSKNMQVWTHSISFSSLLCMLLCTEQMKNAKSLTSEEENISQAEESVTSDAR